MTLLPDAAAVSAHGPPTLLATKLYLPCDQINCTKPAADKMACDHRVVAARKKGRRAKGRTYAQILEARRRAQQAGAASTLNLAELRAMQSVGQAAADGGLQKQCSIESSPDGLM